MVVKPGEKKDLSDTEKKKVAYLESFLDGILSGSDCKDISTQHFSGRAGDKILGMYRRAGWSIQYVSDWRDGDYYQFRRTR